MFLDFVTGSLPSRWPLRATQRRQRDVFGAAEFLIPLVVVDADSNARVFFCRRNVFVLFVQGLGDRLVRGEDRLVFGEGGGQRRYWLRS